MYASNCIPFNHRSCATVFFFSYIKLHYTDIHGIESGTYNNINIYTRLKLYLLGFFFFESFLRCIGYTSDVWMFCMSNKRLNFVFCIIIVVCCSKWNASNNNNMMTYKSRWKQSIMIFVCTTACCVYDFAHVAPKWDK